MKKILISILSALLLCVPTMAETVLRPLHDGWRFRQGNSEIWHPAQVPGNTHLDLMRERIIDDPFFRLNERSVQWVIGCTRRTSSHLPRNWQPPIRRWYLRGSTPMPMSI
ncbi:MAG: hypothetical protein K6D91_02515 [Prevotella sp.]|nr:hypothetical protein [Prevotella sp.]